MTTIVQPTFVDRLKTQAEAVAKSGSTWLGLFIAAVVGCYMKADPATQKGILDAFPFLQGWGGVVTALLPLIVQRLRPPTGVTSATQATWDELVRLRMNEWARAHGLPETPPPAQELQAPAGIVVPSVIATPAKAATTIPSWAQPAEAPPKPPAAPPPPPDPILMALHRFNPQATPEQLASAMADLRSTRPDAAASGLDPHL